MEKTLNTEAKVFKLNFNLTKTYRERSERENYSWFVFADAWEIMF